VHTSFTPALASVPGSGMPRPMMSVGALERPQAKALLEVSLALEGAILGSYISVPPFDANAEVAGSRRHERPPLAPERIQMTEQRVRAIVGALVAPAALRLARVRPWSVGGTLLAMAYAVCFHVSLPLLPSWLLLLYVINGVCLRLLGLNDAEPFEPARNGRSEDPAHARAYTTPGGALPPAAERLRSLEDFLLPLLREVEGYCSACERFASAPLSGDGRASLLAMLALGALTLLGTMLLTVASAAIILAGGPSAAVFDACFIVFAMHIAAFHGISFKDCGETKLSAAEQRRLSAARNNPFGAGGQKVSACAVTIDEEADGGAFLDDERQKHLSTMWSSAWMRLPDLPTQLHRAIARDAIIDLDNPGAKGCLAMLGIR